jgi:hypothetical protein
MDAGRYIMAANIEGGVDEFFVPPRIQRAAHERLGIELRGVVDAVIEEEQLLAELLARLRGARPSPRAADQRRRGAVRWTPV